MQRDFIAVLDFGSQYAHLIAKRCRQLGYFTRIFSPDASQQELAEAKGIILSGGPASVFEANIPQFNAKIVELPVPILGLCYGHQLIANLFGGEINNLGRGEFGKASLRFLQDSPLWHNVEAPSQVWMSHQDSVTLAPKDFVVTGRTDDCEVAAMRHHVLPIFTLQFHAEVNDTQAGLTFLQNFIDLCQMEQSWSMEAFLQQEMREIQQQVGKHKVLLFLSGGVDSSVAYCLLTQALGKDRVLGVFIDNGFMRKNEGVQIMQRYHSLGYENVKSVNMEDKFLQAVDGLTDPQDKRKAIGACFVQVRDLILRDLNLVPEEWMLGQGTLYPDIIESGGTAHSNVIKSHHNRVQEIQDLIAQGRVVEPLKELYKDEVRKLGEVMGLPEDIVWRHPFPGPGLSINVLCNDGKDSFSGSDVIQRRLEQVDTASYSAQVLPVRSVGVQGDQRTYHQPAVLVGPQDWDQLEQVSIRLTNQVRTINRGIALIAPTELPPLKLHSATLTKPRLDLLREADFIATQVLRENDLMRVVFQLLVILLPLSTDGQHECVVLRPVFSEDVMTAQFAKLPWPVVNRMAEKIMALEGIECVFYDVTHKPPATFGWE